MAKTLYFGENLAAVMARPGEEYVPKAAKMLLSWLNKRSKSPMTRALFDAKLIETQHNPAMNLEGLFRVSAGVKELNSLKSQFDSGLRFLKTHVHLQLHLLTFPSKIKRRDL